MSKVVKNRGRVGEEIATGRVLLNTAIVVVIGPDASTIVGGTVVHIQIRPGPGLDQAVQAMATRVTDIGRLREFASRMSGDIDTNIGTIGTVTETTKKGIANAEVLQTTTVMTGTSIGVTRAANRKATEAGIDTREKKAGIGGEVRHPSETTTTRATSLGHATFGLGTTRTPTATRHAAIESEGEAPIAAGTERPTQRCKKEASPERQRNLLPTQIVNVQASIWMVENWMCFLAKFNF